MTRLTAASSGTWTCPASPTSPRPVWADGVAYISTGYMNPELWAIRTDAREEAGSARTLWQWKPGAPAKPSTLLVDGLLYFVSDNGVARCLDARTGKQLWQRRLGGPHTASPIYADSRIYFISEEGEATVIAPGRTFTLLATNHLDGRCLASPAVSGKALFIRTDTHLYRIENP